ncbi:MAG: hypothetical protein AYL28_004660 [Candidatus Bathyarchaeota archaeon B23]|nr:MAG: hypothetical protein AYL28_004660 [Candidatus Bathyarchaeota archaeon B23]
MAVKRIAIMTAWNSDSGVYIHAKPLVHAWREMGLEVRVFSYIPEDFHGRVLFGEDEPYVKRCFGTSTRTNYLDPRPLLMEDYDVLLIEDLKMLPMEPLSRIFSLIRRRAGAVVHILHENTILGPKPPQPPIFYSFKWDAAVYIDERQRWFAEKLYGEKAIYIPFPCYPLRDGDRAQLRERLGLEVEGPLILVYALGGYTPYLPELPAEGLEEARLLILAKEGEEVFAYPQTEFRRTRPLTDEELDLYVLASDAVILHKVRAPPYPIAVTSTAVYQLLGAQRPLLVPRLSEYFLPFEGVVLKYSDRVELRRLLVRALRGGRGGVEETMRRARSFVEERSPKVIAEKYLRLFEELR